MNTREIRLPSIGQRRILGSILAAALLPWFAFDAAATEDGGFAKVLQPAFQQTCVKCHGKNDRVKGKVNLLELRNSRDLVSNPELIRKLIEALDLKEMPPEDEPALPAEKREQLLSTLKGLMRAAISAQSSLPQTPIRRMNRFQYNNAVQDLFNLNVEVFALPERMLREHGKYFQPKTGRMPENLSAGSRPLGKSQLIAKRLAGVAPFPQDLRAEHGFDNRGDHLSLSPLLLESLLQLSSSIVHSEDFDAQTCGIRKEFFAPPDNTEDVESEVRRRMQSFLTRAFRRPVERSLVDRYAAHALGLMESGESFTQGMKAAAAASLASPRFLYLYDQAGKGDSAEPLDHFELASRLSFFLWGSIPDQPLLDAAAAGKLAHPDNLAKEIDRMLNDRRMKRFCDSFPSQWLQLERIIASVPDPQLHPNFYFAKYRASMHMMLEPLLLFETLLVEDRSILQLIDSDFSYRSDLLEAWYQNGGKNAKARPTAIPFRRVEVTDRRQGGVITTAAVMTMTSNPTRTQPITRGAWIASVIFNDPPEPPPADVPPLPENKESEDAKNLTLRERLDAHRDRPDCAGCHAKIDPLGFALENYGPTGLWRDNYRNGRKVDVSGSLFRTHEFSDIVEFKDAILSEKKRFARAFSAHLLAFALGRELSATDSPALDRIVDQTAHENFRLRAVIKQIVLSEPFRHKSNPAVPDQEHAQQSR